ncbi:OsmC family protein [Salisaeta longa]|uniref:OsmC family protein n=1 Tax=Salisaeta longa TaxID=503170 RepID=UPI0003B5726D|nr:OsmC family protein [Salisaeta longa]
MPTRTAEATWNGDLKSGTGHMTSQSGAVDDAFSFVTRFGDKDGTNPEELIGAAHAGCFSMAFSNMLAEAGYTPTSVHTTAHVHLDDESLSIDHIKLVTEAEVPGLDEETFQEHAQQAKAGCPVSKLYQGAEITLEATLKG